MIQTPRTKFSNVKKYDFELLTFLTYEAVSGTDLLLFRQNKHGKAALQNLLPDQKRVQARFSPSFSAGNFSEAEVVYELVT